MLDWMKSLNLELQMLDHIEDIKNELGVYPTKVNQLGVVPEEIMRVYTLFAVYDRAHDEAEIKLKWDPANQELKMKTAELENKANFLHNLLSLCLKEHFHAWNKSIVIAKDNIAYSFDMPVGPADFFKKFLGGE